jgi:hypothetical protein
MTFQPRGFSLVKLGELRRDLPIFENLSIDLGPFGAANPHHGMDSKRETVYGTV